MANIKDLLGELYKEGMTNDEIVEALSGVNLPQDRTDEVEKYKQAVSKANSEAAEYKRQLKNHMSEEEKKKTEEAERFDKMQKENEALKKQIAIAELTKKFQSSGLDAETATKSAEAALEGNMDAVISAFTDKIAKAADDARAQLISQTPALQGGNGTAEKVKDYGQDIEGAIANGDMTSAAAFMRLQNEQNTNS